MISLRKPVLLVLAGAAVCSAATAPALAEVYAVLNPDGSYQGTRIARAEGGGSVWGSLGLAESRKLVLNAGGDRRGDGSPVIVTDRESGLPFAAWSTRTPTGKRDIQVAAFNGEEWIAFPLVGLAGGDDLEPDLMVLPGLVVAAWTHGRATPSVWVSVHAATMPGLGPDSGWLNPMVVHGGERAHSPRLAFNASGRLVVQSVGRGRPAIQEDLVLLPGTDASDGPVPLPPGGSPSGPDSGHDGGNDNGAGGNLHGKGN